MKCKNVIEGFVFESKYIFGPVIFIKTTTTFTGMTFTSSTQTYKIRYFLISFCNFTYSFVILLLK